MNPEYIEEMLKGYPEILRYSHISKIYGRHYTSIWRDVRAGTFIHHIDVGGRPGWPKPAIREDLKRLQPYTKIELRKDAIQRT